MAIKVTQAQIDAIKKMGMTGALKGASAMSPAMKEGVRRLYGEKRFAAAIKTSKPAAKSADSARSAATAKVAPKKAAPKTGAAKPAFSTTSTKAPAQKTKQLKNNPLAKFVTSRVGGKSGGM
jgi:hypothetical protein